MPIIKSAKKRVRQNEKRRKRNYITRSKLRTHLKKAQVSLKEGNLEAATKDVQVAYSIIDTAVKKHIIHKNNAARKKSQLGLALNKLQAGGGEKETTKKASTKKASKKSEDK